MLELAEIAEPTFRRRRGTPASPATSLHADVWHVVTGRPYFAARGDRYVIIGHDDFGDKGNRWFGHHRSHPQAAVVRPIWRPGKTSPTADPLTVLRDLLEAGKITPAVGRVVPLSEIPAAMECLESGKVLGKIVIKL